MISIYLLRDPITYQPKYVGQTSRAPEDRLDEHIHKAHKQKNAKAVWLIALEQASLRPIIEILAYCESNAVAIERGAIDKFRRDGYTLFNIARPIKPHYSGAQPSYVPLLGAISDSDIAKQFGITQSTVREARARRGIAPYNHPCLNRNNVGDYVHMLGVVSDSVIAKRFGVSKQAVIKQRCKRGILPPAQFWAQYENMLGTMSDKALGELVGRSRKAVEFQRDRRGIPPYRKHGK